MDDVAETSADDCVVLIPSGSGETAAPSFFPASHLRITVVPATRPLAEISSHGSYVSELGSGHSQNRFKKSWILILDQGASRQFRQARQSPDLDSAPVFFYVGESGNTAEVDNDFWFDNPVFDLP